MGPPCPEALLLGGQDFVGFRPAEPQQGLRPRGPGRRCLLLSAKPRAPGLVASLGSGKDASLPHLPIVVCPSSLLPPAPRPHSVLSETADGDPDLSLDLLHWSSCHLVTLSVNPCPPARPCPSAPPPPALILLFLGLLPHPPTATSELGPGGELSPSPRVNRNFLGPKVLESHPFPTSPGEGAMS